MPVLPISAHLHLVPSGRSAPSAVPESRIRSLPAPDGWVYIAGITANGTLVVEHHCRAARFQLTGFRILTATEREVRQYEAEHEITRPTLVPPLEADG